MAFSTVGSCAVAGVVTAPTGPGYTAGGSEQHGAPARAPVLHTQVQRAGHQAQSAHPVRECRSKR